MFKVRDKVFVMEDNKVVEKRIRAIKITAHMQEEVIIDYELINEFSNRAEIMLGSPMNSYDERWVYKTKADLLKSL